MQPASQRSFQILFFLHAMALGSWFVPLSPVLDAHGLSSIKPFAFATAAVAAFVSPLFFGAMADHRMAPIRVLRRLAVACAASMGLAATAIHRGWGPIPVLLLIQLLALVSAPTWSLSTTIVMARLERPQSQFGPIRAMATFGWMAGCWLVSLVGADASAAAGALGAMVWLALAVFSLRIPALDPPHKPNRLTLKERWGLDALHLLKHRDHRVVFITAALFSIPIAAFYPHTPPQLRDLGLEHSAAWMTLGQVTEVIAMFSLGWLLVRFRLKWIFGAGLAFGVVRYALCSRDGIGWVLSGVSLHGLAYTLFFITAQIYLEQRVESRWRARAQALLTLMVNGVGSLVGYLGSGWWWFLCQRGGTTDWPRFWSGLSLAVAAVWVYFVLAYRGRKGLGAGATRA